MAVIVGDEKFDSLDEYQKLAETSAVFPEDRALGYLSLGVTSEAGEVAGLIKKHIRDGTPLDRGEMLAELGDVLWYVAVLADRVGYPLSSVASANIRKLASRKARNKLGGSGDHR